MCESHGRWGPKGHTTDPDWGQTIPLWARQRPPPDASAPNHCTPPTRRFVTQQTTPAGTNAPPNSTAGDLRASLPKRDARALFRWAPPSAPPWPPEKGHRLTAEPVPENDLRAIPCQPTWQTVPDRATGHSPNTGRPRPDAGAHTKGLGSGIGDSGQRMRRFVLPYAGSQSPWVSQTDDDDGPTKYRKTPIPAYPPHGASAGGRSVSTNATNDGHRVVF